MLRAGSKPTGVVDASKPSLAKKVDSSTVNTGERIEGAILGGALGIAAACVARSKWQVSAAMLTPLLIAGPALGAGLLGPAIHEFLEFTSVSDEVKSSNGRPVKHYVPRQSHETRPLSVIERELDAEKARLHKYAPGALRRDRERIAHAGRYNGWWLGGGVAAGIGSAAAIGSGMDAFLSNEAHKFTNRQSNFWETFTGLAAVGAFVGAIVIGSVIFARTRDNRFEAATKEAAQSPVVGRYHELRNELEDHRKQITERPESVRAEVDEMQARRFMKFFDRNTSGALEYGNENTLKGARASEAISSDLYIYKYQFDAAWKPVYYRTESPEFNDHLIDTTRLFKTIDANSDNLVSKDEIAIFQSKTREPGSLPDAVGGAHEPYLRERSGLGKVVVAHDSLEDFFATLNPSN